jgi:VWFA-related protein
VPLTRERQVLEARIARVDSIGGTALYDAVEAGTEAVRAGTHDRRVLVVISDGRDNASQESFAGALTRAERADVAVFAIGLGDDRHARHDLDRLTQRTGGAVLYPMHDVKGAALDIARRIRTQYTVAYAPMKQALDGSYRAIKVSVGTSGHPRVRTKSGYWATR